MTKRKGADSAIAVLQRIAQQERLLAQGELFTAMQQARQAENEKLTLDRNLENYHMRLAQGWRAGATQAINQAMNSLGYRHWLHDEIGKAEENVAAKHEELTLKTDNEARLRAHSRLLETLAERRYEQARYEATQRTYKTLDEIVMLKLGRRHHDH